MRRLQDRYLTRSVRCTLPPGRVWRQVFGQEWDGPSRRTVLIDAHVDGLGFRHMKDLASTFSLDANLHRDRGAADAHQAGEESHHVTDKHWAMKLDPVERDRHQERRRAAPVHNLTAGADRAGLVEIAQDDPA